MPVTFGAPAPPLLLPLQLLWANVHGYFILGPLAVAAVGGGHLLRGATGFGSAGRWVAVPAVRKRA